MARRIFAGRGRAQIELSGGMRAAVDRLLSSRTYKPIVDRLEREAADLYTEAMAAWPEKTGKSKASLEHGLRLPEPTAIEAYVSFDKQTAGYVFFITEKWPNRRKFVWRELLQKPARRRGKRLAVELGDALRRLVEG